MSHWYTLIRTGMITRDCGKTRAPASEIHVSDVDLARADKCVNACSGMSDPEGEIQRLRAERDRYEKALKEIESHHATQNDRAGRPQEKSRTLSIVRTALSAKEAE